MQHFLPELGRLTSWPLLIAVAVAALAAAGSGKLTAAILRARHALLMVPWIVLAGTAADHVRFDFDALARAPHEMLDHGQTTLAEVTPSLGVSVLLLVALLGLAARRHRVPVDRMTLLLHALPAALLVVQGWRLHAVLENDTLYDATETAAALDTGMPWLTVAAALVALATVAHHLAAVRKGAGPHEESGARSGSTGS